MGCSSPGDGVGGEAHMERFGELEGIWGVWGKVGGPRVGFGGSRVSTEVGVAGTAVAPQGHVVGDSWGSGGHGGGTGKGLGVWGVRGKFEASGGRI